MEDAHPTFVIHTDPVVVIEAQRFGSWSQYERKVHKTDFHRTGRRRSGIGSGGEIGKVTVHFDHVTQRFVVEIGQ